jgi:hypothetical protein
MPADARRFVRRVRSYVVAGIPIFERGEYAEAMLGRARQLQRTGKREEAMANIGTLSCSLFFSAFALSDALSAEYTLMPSPQTVHIGYFSAALKPALTINSGDIVTIESVGGPDAAEVDASGVVPPSAVPEHTRTIRREVTDRGPGPHTLTGPIFINGATLGDVLEVRILEIDPAVPHGFNTQRPYTGALPEEFPASSSASSRLIARRKPRRSRPESLYQSRGHSSASWALHPCPRWVALARLRPAFTPAILTTRI